MADPDRDRLFTPALALFLLGVAGVVGWAVATRYPEPDLEGCIELLADGDLDRVERERILLRTMDLCMSDGSARGRAAGFLAAVALQQGARSEQLAPPVEGFALPLDQRRWLDLGDPLLGNLLDAMLLEAAGAEEAARTRWSQVAAQARMVGNKLAADRAAAAVERLR